MNSKIRGLSLPEDLKLALGRAQSRTLDNIRTEMTAQLTLIVALMVLGYFVTASADAVSSALSSALYPFTFAYLILFSLTQFSYKKYKLSDSLRQVLGQWLRGGILAMVATLTAFSIVLELSLNELVYAKVRILVGLTLISLAYTYLTAYLSNAAEEINGFRVTTKARKISGGAVVATLVLLNLIIPVV